VIVRKKHINPDYDAKTQDKSVGTDRGMGTVYIFGDRTPKQSWPILQWDCAVIYTGIFDIMPFLEPWLINTYKKAHQSLSNFKFSERCICEIIFPGCIPCILFLLLRI
jgi:hypothetical protein